MPPGGERRRGIVWASPSSDHEARVGPREIDGHTPAAGADEGRGLFEQGAACSTPGRRSTRASSDSLKPSGPRARTCRFAGPMTVCTTSPAEPAMLAVGDQRREHERHGDRHAQAGEQLLRACDAQAPAVQVEQRVGAHQRPRGLLSRFQRRSPPAWRAGGRGAQRAMLVLALPLASLSLPSRSASCGRRSPPRRRRG
jgi:hypothetical protein